MAKKLSQAQREAQDRLDRWLKTTREWVGRRVEVSERGPRGGVTVRVGVCVGAVLRRIGNESAPDIWLTVLPDESVKYNSRSFDGLVTFEVHALSCNAAEQSESEGA